MTSLIRISAVAMLFAAAHVSAGVIDFDGVSEGTILNPLDDGTDAYAGQQFVDDGVSLSMFAGLPINVGSNHPWNVAPWNTTPTGQVAAVAFNTNNPTGGDHDLGAPFTRESDGATLSPGNIVVLHEHPNDCNLITGICEDPDDIGARPAGRFLLVFSEDVILESIDFFDVEPEEGNHMFIDNGFVLYDSQFSALNTGGLFVPDTGGDNKWDRLAIHQQARAVEIRLGGSGGFDNVAFSRVDVPAPATALLMLGGVLGLALARRRRGAVAD